MKRLPDRLAAACAVCLGLALSGSSYGQPGTMTPQLPTEFPKSTTAPAERFGIQTHMARTNNGWGPKMLPLIRHLGVGSIRDEDNWVFVEPKLGVYQTTPAVEEAITGIDKQGQDTLFMFGYGNPLYKNPVDPQAFTKHALWLIEHYKGRLNYFEVWSEPDLRDFIEQYGGQWNGKEADGSDSPWIKKFAETVTYVARAIKQKHPDVKLVGCSAVSPSAMRMLHYPEMWRDIDIFAIHPYPYHLPPEILPWGGKEYDERDGIKTADADHSFSSHIRLFREGLARVGRPDMPIWITEVGYSTARVKKTGLFQGYTEQAQAIYTVRMALQSAGLGVERTYFYDLYDDGDSPHEIEDNFGLVRRDYSLKPSFTALQHLCTLMPGDTRPQPLDVKVDRLSPWRPEDVPHTYAFKRPDGSMIVFLWQAGRIYADAQEEWANLTINAPDLQVLETGRVVSGSKLTPKVSREGNSLLLTELPFGADPVYIILK